MKLILHSQILGEGFPMIILHGFLGMSDNWKTLGRRFAGLGLEVHLVDQRNHGRSFHSDEFGYSLMANDLNNYYEHHTIKEAVLLGHSMGGKTAMEFSVTYPDKVKGLIVADIAPKEYPQHHQDILKALNSLDFSVIKNRKQADEVLSAYITDFGIRQFLLKNLYWKEKGVLDLRINLKVLSTTISEIGKTLQPDTMYVKKTIFVKGARSGYIDPVDKIGIRKHFPNSEIDTVKDSGHWLHAENPHHFYEIVMKFLQNEVKIF